MYAGKRNFWENIKDSDLVSKWKVIFQLGMFLIVSFLVYGTFIVATFGIKEWNTNYISQACIFLLSSYVLSFFTSLTRRKELEYIDMYFNSTLMRIIPIHLIFFAAAIILKLGNNLALNMLLLMIIFGSLKILIEGGIEVNDEKIRNSKPRE